MHSLHGKTAVVTGASRGLGQQVALRLAQHGAAIALLARNESALQATKDRIAALGGTVIIAPADVSSPESVESARGKVHSELGVPSILVNAAGVFGPISLIQDSDPAAWIETLQINTIGPFLTCRAFVGGMIQNGWGRIINFTSAASLHVPGPANSAYGTSKAALNQFTRHLASELRATGVTANVIHPGDVKTEMWRDIQTKAERLGPVARGYTRWANWVEQTGGDDPGKAADLVLELTAEDASGVNGQFLWIKDGLQAPLPSWEASEDQRPWRK